MRSLIWLLLVLACAGCGDLPQPFAGRPGATALRLAGMPPPARLAVPPPTGALLADDAAKVWADATADALVGLEVPAVAKEIRPGDWRLIMTAKASGNAVVPTYTVQNPRGKAEGSTDGPPIEAQLWANGDRTALSAAAIAAAPKIAALLTSIEAAQMQSDPNSLLNRPARLVVPDVKGAPGDGDLSLAAQMRRQLPRNGEVVQDSPQGADFIVQGLVHTAPGAGGTMRVEIQWVVSDAQGREAGRIIQINEVPPGSLNHYWGDVAMVVAQEAAGGIRKVIDNRVHLR
jgi:hypothetical protein